MTIKGRWGFTLIELIIVIIIISTMSFMVFSENMGGGVKDRERVSPLNLRQSIRKLANGEQITLFCIDGAEVAIS